MHNKSEFKAVMPAELALQRLLEGIPCSKVKNKHTKREQGMYNINQKRFGNQQNNRSKLSIVTPNKRHRLTGLIGKEDPVKQKELGLMIFMMFCYFLSFQHSFVSHHPHLCPELFCNPWNPE